MNFKSDLATKVENFDFLTSGLKYILSSSEYLSGLEMCVKAVCTLVIDGKHILLTCFSKRTKTNCN